MASRRRIGQMMGGMRLGDLAAQLDARRMNRDEQRMDREQEAMRWRAANQALSQVLGGVQAFADRQDALEERDYRRGRDAAADEQASELHRYRVRQLEDDVERRARQAALDSLATGRDLVARSSPNRQPTAEAALDGGFVDEDGIVGDFTGGVWDFAGFDEDPEAFAVRRMADEWEEELRAVGFPVEVPRAELEAQARELIAATKGQRAAAQSAAAAAEGDARVREAQAALAAAKTETERARAQKLLAEARKAARTPTAAAAAPKRTVADYAPDEPLPKELQAHPDVTKKMVEYELLEAAIDDVMAAKDELKVDTGPVRGLLGEVANWLGIEAIEPAALRAMTGEVFARYVQSISGAAASDKEIQRLMRNMATMRDQDDVFKAKLQVMKRLTQIRKDALLRTYQRAGFPLGRWTVSPEPEPASGVASAQTTATPRGGASLTPEQIQALRAHEQALLSAGMEPGQVKEQLRVMMAQMRGGA